MKETVYTITVWYKQETKHFDGHNSYTDYYHYDLHYVGYTGFTEAMKAVKRMFVGKHDEDSRFTTYNYPYKVEVKPTYIMR